MEEQRPAPQDEVSGRSASGGMEGQDLSGTEPRPDLAAIQAQLLGATGKRPGRRLILVGLIAAALVAGWLGYQSFIADSPVSGPAASAPAVAATRPAIDPVTPPPNGLAAQQGASWGGAEQAYADKQYDLALRQYKRLAAMTAGGPGHSAVTELFRLRIADCLQKVGTAEEYRRQLSEIDDANSPFVFSLANYRLAGLDCQQELWLEGRTRAYRALAAGGLTGPGEPLQADCQFLVARCLTQQVLKLTGVDAVIPWSEPPLPDPIAPLNERDLMQVILRGSEAMGKAALGPRLEKAGGSAGGVLWQAGCWRSPIEQIVSRFAHQSGLNVEWVSVAPPVRQRPVTLLTDGMNPRGILETAAGAAGLVARFEGLTVRVLDVSACESVQQQQQLLASEAAAAWTRLALAGAGSARAAEAQYAMGILRECMGDHAAAISEHRQLALRFPRSRVAPHALMRSARANLALRDYGGAQEDLTALLNTYPEHPGMEQVFLLLARAYTESGRTADAVALFRKVFLLDRSTETKTEAALGAGRSCHRIGEHAEALRWLERFITLAKPQQHPEVPASYLMLARSHLAAGDVGPAVRALRSCLSVSPAPDIERAALIELARAEAERMNLVAAIGICNRAAEKSPTPHDRDEMAILRAQIHRRMGLPDKAAAELKQHLAEISDEPETVKACLELARCYQEGGSEAEAHSVLSDLLSRVKSDRDAEAAKGELAELSVKLGKGEQAIVLAEDLLKTSRDPALRRRCHQTLAAAHLAAKDFEKAASAITAAGAGLGGPPK